MLNFPMGGLWMFFSALGTMLFTRPKILGIVFLALTHALASQEKSTSESASKMIPASQANAPSPFESASKVSVTIQGLPAEWTPGLVYSLSAQLNMQAGWHTNANPASLDYLIPTSLEWSGSKGVKMTVQYPQGLPFEFSTGGDTLSVYENGTTIPFKVALKSRIDPATFQPQIKITFQACNHNSCIAPSTVTLDLKAEPAPTLSSPPPTTKTLPKTILEKAKANALLHEKSPYLLQHAYNPVNWQPWSEAAIAQARAQNKPIFLSIGYSTCHWCHVMEHESFSNPEIADYMNEHFINIKVDREERPDVDGIYMAYLQAATGSGGWPLSVFLTPELHPFFGGTYYPPEAKHGQPGFQTVLSEVKKVWDSDADTLKMRAANIMLQLESFTGVKPTNRDNTLTDSVFEKAFETISARFDEKWGGFGAAPKFPRPVTLEFLFAYASQPNGDAKKKKHALHMAVFTLQAMAKGGIHDHLGGGFHRYSTDKYWLVPHFEKMLYDQSQIVMAHLRAHAINQDPFHANIAKDILSYVQRDMLNPQGGFHSAEDADSYKTAAKKEKAEGAFYVWSQEEINTLLGEDLAPLFKRRYGIEEKGNVSIDPHGEFGENNILYEAVNIETLAQEFEKPKDTIIAQLNKAKNILYKKQITRPRPHLDDKAITAWNGLMISAFARAGKQLNHPDYITTAQNAAHFIRKRLYQANKKTLIRSYREGASNIEGFAGDYAFLIQGLLDLHEADADSAWLDWAIELQATQDRLFLDTTNGGYFGVTGKDPHILLRIKESYDGAEPTPTSVSVLNLPKLSALTQDESYLKKAEQSIHAFSQILNKQPSSMPLLTAVWMQFQLYQKAKTR